jgi:hypothetical protein
VVFRSWRRLAAPANADAYDDLVSKRVCRARHSRHRSFVGKDYEAADILTRCPVRICSAQRQIGPLRGSADADERVGAVNRVSSGLPSQRW